MEHGFKVLKGKLGADHIEIFWATTGMADMYRSLGRTREALALDEPLLKLRTAKMGLDHPDTLHSLRAVAQDYVELGRLDDAVALLRDTVKLSTAKLGSDHSQTLLAIRTLAGVLRSQGRLAEAQEILQGQASAGDQAKRESAATTGSSPQAGGQVGAPKNPSETAGEPEERVDAFVRNGRWQEAISELAKALELSPTNHALLRKRGEILGRIGHWKEAAASLSKSIEAEPTDSRPYLFLAPTMLLIDDVEGYRQVCRRAVTQFSGTRDLAPADTLAKVCALHPSSGVDLSVAAKAAETAVTLGKQTEYLPWFALCKGLTEYRQEHFTGAAEWAQRSLSAAGQIPERDAAAHLVLAMAQMRLHQTTASRDAFAKGVELVEQKLPKIDGGDLGWQWVDVIIANILLREAKALNHLSPEEQANTFARSGRWKEAAAETVRAIESEPTNHLLFHMLAPLLVATRDLTGYRQHCRKVPLRFGGTTDPDTADRMAKDALILPDSGVDIEAVRAWAATAVSGPPTPADAWHHSVRGLAEYRQGNFAQAAEWLGKVPIDGTEPERDAQVLLLQAMTQQHRTNTPAARAFLAKGAAIMNEKLPQMESGNVGDDWIDWIIAQALWREATALFVNTGTRKID
jgi:tetratricopeptide (TPR) repeat protein